MTPPEKDRSGPAGPILGAREEGRSGEVPAVTVVIPTTGRSYLAEAVDSVLTQTIRDFEIIVVADGCPTDMVDLEERDDRIHIVRQEKMGVSVARNLGVMHSRADLVAFLDDDDVMHPERLERQVDAMRSHPEAALCYSGSETIDGFGSTLRTDRAQSLDYLKMLEQAGDILMSSVLIRRRIVNVVGGFDPLLTVAQDLDFLYKVIRLYPAIFLPDVLVKYRRHDTNASGLPSDADPVLRILRAHRRLGRRQGRPDIVRAATVGMRVTRNWYAEVAIESAFQALKDGEYVSAVRMATNSLILGPAFSLRWISHKLARRVSD
jgi:glycosyltransferase involved in cell wall biosynthesis